MKDDKNKNNKKQELNEKELKDVNGGAMSPKFQDYKNPFNKLNKDPRDKSKIPEHIVLS